MPRHNSPRDVTGEIFGRLTAVRYEYTDKNNHRKWLFSCACGNSAVLPLGRVVTGNTKSCGCLRTEKLKERAHILYQAAHNAQVTHGMSRTRVYRIWKAMKGRCYNPNLPGYNYYGGRGIHVCKEWRYNAQAFIEWALSHGYSNKLEIDRIDNDGPYSPENCRWATRQQQVNNFSRNRRITYNGKTMTCAEWDRELGFPESTVANRISDGFSEIEAVSTPRFKKRKYFHAA